MISSSAACRASAKRCASSSASIRRFRTGRETSGRFRVRQQIDSLGRSPETDQRAGLSHGRRQARPEAFSAVIGRQRRLVRPAAGERLCGQVFLGEPQPHVTLGGPDVRTAGEAAFQTCKGQGCTLDPVGRRLLTNCLAGHAGEDPLRRDERPLGLELGEQPAGGGIAWTCLHGLAGLIADGVIVRLVVGG